MPNEEDDKRKVLKWEEQANTQDEARKAKLREAERNREAERKRAEDAARIKKD